MDLRNKYDRATLQKRLDAETFTRTTLSFYRYVHIADPGAFRDDLYSRMNLLGVLGRVYVAEEGVNAQISVPEPNFDALRSMIDADTLLKEVPFKIAVEDNGKSFLKLIVRLKKKIVADGLNDDVFDTSNVGTHLTAAEFNAALEQPGTVVIDMRNHYESEVGHFEGALCPDADTFREALDKGLELAEPHKDQKILLYCTGGIRCEKASAWFRHHGYKDVNQLYGGIIEYAREVKSQGLPSRFIGKNFVFDERMGERITDDVIASCHQCEQPSDRHVNCAYMGCHALFIQCESCAEKWQGCCSEACYRSLNDPQYAARAVERQTFSKSRRKGTDSTNK